MPEMDPTLEDDDLRPCAGTDCPMRLRCWRHVERERNGRPLLPLPPVRWDQHGPYCRQFLEARGGPWLTPPWANR